MRGYVALNGRDGAFGWGRRGGDGEYALTFSGLASGKEYMLSSGETIMADSSGMWHGKRKEMPLFAAADGKVNGETVAGDRDNAGLYLGNIAEHRLFFLSL